MQPKKSYVLFTARRVARIWKRGGLFWKSEKRANDLDPNFHCSWISFTRFVRKLRRNFSVSSEIQRFFPPKIKWSPKKKRSSPKLRLIFRPKSEPNRLRGAIFNFSQKIGLKTTKMVRFCILHKPMGEARAPRPPPLLAALLFTATLFTAGLRLVTYNNKFEDCSRIISAREKAKNLCCLQVKTPPVHRIWWRLHTDLLLLTVKQEKREYRFLVFRMYHFLNFDLLSLSWHRYPILNAKFWRKRIRT